MRRPWTRDGNNQCFVSISDEKPAPMRLLLACPGSGLSHRFNLRREASPHATPSSIALAPIVGKFQSQTRSQPPCDGSAEVGAVLVEVVVSISDEKPAPMRLSK